MLMHLHDRSARRSINKSLKKNPRVGDFFLESLSSGWSRFRLGALPAFFATARFRFLNVRFQTLTPRFSFQAPNRFRPDDWNSSFQKISNCHDDEYEQQNMRNSRKKAGAEKVRTKSVVQHKDFLRNDFVSSTVSKIINWVNGGNSILTLYLKKQVPGQ